MTAKDRFTVTSPLQPATPRLIAAVAVGVVVAALVAYFNSLSAPFVFDDRAAILENPSIRRMWPVSDALSPPSGGQSVSGRPLVNLSLAVNYSLGGTNPWGYHALNLLIHVLAGMTLFGVLRRTWSSTSGAPPAHILAAGTAVLWVLHPLQTASVTYVVQRAESLMGLFYLLTLYSFIRGSEAGCALVAQRGAASAPPTTLASRAWFAVSIFACLLGMASKEVMVTAPLIVLLYDRTFVAGSFRAAWVQRRGYYLALAGTWLLLAILLLGSRGRGGTVGFGAGVGWWHYLLTQCEAIGLYLRLSLWPHPLVFDRGERVVTRLAEVLPEALLVLALVGGTVVALRRRPVLGFLGAWFFAILAPTSSIVPVASQTIAEHRMYLPLAAVIVAMVAGAHALFGRRAIIPLFPLCFVALGLTVARNRIYGSEIDLWADTAARAPANVRAHVNLGGALLDAGRVREAAAAYEHASRLRPDSAEVHVNLCHAYTRLGRLEDAVTHGTVALQLDPESTDARINLAHALVQLGKTEEAVGHYEAALRAQPNALDVQVNLADALLNLGRSAPAIDHYRAALSLELRRAEIHGKLAKAFLRQGDLAGARRECAEALRLKPDDPEALFVWGNLCIAAEEYTQAITAFRRALAVAPDYIAARNNLANVLLVTGRIDAAITEYREVLRQRPNDRSVQENLQRALELQAAQR